MTTVREFHAASTAVTESTQNINQKQFPKIISERYGPEASCYVHTLYLQCHTIQPSQSSPTVLFTQNPSPTTNQRILSFDIPTRMQHSSQPSSSIPSVPLPHMHNHTRELELFRSDCYLSVGPHAMDVLGQSTTSQRTLGRGSRRDVDLYRTSVSTISTTPTHQAVLRL